jgi:hypothetical protein
MTPKWCFVDKIVEGAMATSLEPLDQVVKVVGRFGVSASYWLLVCQMRKYPTGY